jgi:hypothetical protein
MYPDIIPVKQRTFEEFLIRFKGYWSVITGDFVISKAEIAMVDDQKTAGLEFGIEHSNLVFKLLKNKTICYRSLKNRFSARWKTAM